MSALRCHCCGQAVDAGDLEAAIERMKPSQRQRTILETLASARGKVVSYGRLIDTLYGGDPDGGPLDAKKLVKVFVYQMHERLAAAGLVVETVWAQGLRLMPTPNPAVHPTRTPDLQDAVVALWLTRRFDAPSIAGLLRMSEHDVAKIVSRLPRRAASAGRSLPSSEQEARTA